MTNDQKNIFAVASDYGNVMPSSDFMSKNQTLETVKELFDPKKIEKITDLTQDEIKLITRMKIMAHLKKLEIWTVGLDYYMSLRLSDKRQSRKELISVLANKGEQKGLGQRLREVFKPTE